MVEAGQVRPVICRTYPLDDTVEALLHVASGHARGKVVLAVSTLSTLPNPPRGVPASEVYKVA